MMTQVIGSECLFPELRRENWVSIQFTHFWGFCFSWWTDSLPQKFYRPHCLGDIRKKRGNSFQRRSSIQVVFLPLARDAEISSSIPAILHKTSSFEDGWMDLRGCYYSDGIGIYFHEFCFILCTDELCTVRPGSRIQLSVLHFKPKQLTQPSRIAEYLWILKKGVLFLRKWEEFTVGLRESCSGQCGLHHGRCSGVSWGAAACTFTDKQKAATGWSKMIHSE